MNQGAIDANAESARLAASSKQDAILSELRRMNVLLTRIANNTARDNTFILDLSDNSNCSSK